MPMRPALALLLLSASVAEQLADQGWDTYGEVVVFLERSDALHTGQFRTRSSMDPDASRRDADLRRGNCDLLAAMDLVP